MKLFNKGRGRPVTALSALIGNLTHRLSQNGTQSFLPSDLAKAAISMESIDAGVAQSLTGALDNLGIAMESMVQGTAFAGIENFQRDAAVVAAASASDMAGFLSIAQESHPTNVPAGTVVVGTSESVPRLSQALEAYSEEANKNAGVYSVAYNMQASRQDEFGETLFPTVVVTPDQIGYLVSIQLITVYEEVRRNTNGNRDDFGRRNIVHAVRDHTILDNHQTDIVPVHSTETAQYFPTTALMPVREVVVGRETVETSSFLFGKQFSLLGVSSTDALIASGLLDSTDSLDPDVRLKAVYLQLVDGSTNEVIAFNTSNIKRSQFNYAVQGRDREMTLNFQTSSLKIDKDVKTIAGAASAILDPVIANDYVVRLSAQVFGNIDLQLADTRLTAGEVEIAEIVGPDGTVYAPTSTDPIIVSIVDAFAGAKLLAYDLQARRTNANRRQRGQLLDTFMFNQLYAVPLLSPITVPRPLGQGDQTDAADLAALITSTRIRASNSAVTELFRAATAIKEFYSARDAIGKNSEILGVASHLVSPFYAYKDLNLTEVVDSVKSSERWTDIAEAIVGVIREVAYRAYRESNYKAAADALAGGNSTPPTVIVATDQITAQWIMLLGDRRTVGNEFNLKIVATQDKRMDGKMFVTFGQFAGGSDGAPNPLHFGNMAWKPELTLALPLHRNGANSKELTVQPSFRHITNLPILAEFDVSGLTELNQSKVTSNWNEV